MHEWQHLLLPLFQWRPHLSYSIKALKSEQEDPPSSTAFLAVSPSFFALLLISSASSPIIIWLLYSFTFNMISMHSRPFLNSIF